MIYTYKRKLILTKAQSTRIVSWIGACRLVYNMALEIRKDYYNKKNSYLTYNNLTNQLPIIRKEISWIGDVPAHSLQEVIRKRLDFSFKSFFRSKGYPKFASKKNYKSISFTDKKKMRVIRNSDIIIIPKIGSLKFHKDSEILGILKTATIKLEPTGFFVYMVCDNVPKKFESESQAIGLDMGISQFCVDSNGGMIANPKHFAKYERQLRVENRSLSRKKRGSNSRKKQAKRLALLHHKIANVRKDFLHKESTKIAKANSVVYVENLKIDNMAKNKKLSKHILDCGWGMFRDMLTYKTTVVRVDPKHTSQTCDICAHVDKESRVSQSKFKCTHCGHEDNADINAAKNIKSRGTALVRKREASACALDLESISTDMSAVLVETHAG